MGVTDLTVFTNEHGTDLILDRLADLGLSAPAQPGLALTRQPPARALNYATACAPPCQGHFSCRWMWMNSST
jgi:hypothetical protein